MKVSLTGALLAIGLLACEHVEASLHGAGSSRHGAAAAHRRHFGKEARREDTAHLEAHLAARQGGSYSGRATFYQPGLGACGGYNSESDFIVALNTAQFGNGAGSSWCGKQISISYGGQTHTATIVDSCPSCPYGGIDMSPSLFSSFADQSQGVLQVNWHLAGQEPPKPSPKPTTTSTSSSSSKYTPPPTTSSTSSTSTSTSSGTSTSSSTASTSTSSSSTATSTSTTSNSSTSSTHNKNLQGLGDIFDGFVQIAQQGHDNESSAPAAPTPAPAA